MPNQEVTMDQILEMYRTLDIEPQDTIAAEENIKKPYPTAYEETELVFSHSSLVK